MKRSFLRVIMVAVVLSMAALNGTTFWLTIQKIILRMM